MNANPLSRRAVVTAAIATAATAGLQARAAEPVPKGGSVQDDKYLQTILKFWKLWEATPPNTEAIAAMFTDDCIIRVGTAGETVSEGKQASRALLRSIGQGSQYKITIPRTFVTGRVVVTEFDFSSAKKDGAMKQAAGHYAGVFIFKGDKIWMWTDVES